MRDWTKFRLAVNKALLDRNMTKRQLVEQINEATGRSYDTQYLAKVCDGERWSGCVMQHLCRILGFQFPEGYWKKEEAAEILRHWGETDGKN